jgi:CRISPR type III-A-associated protein Csm2
MRPELVDGEAIEVAKAWAELNSSQLRRFFSEVMALRRQVDLDPKLPDDHIRARLALLKARAAYTYGRDKNRIPPRLVEFFRDHALSVKDKTDFQAFNRHFESVVAFHKFYAKSKN